MSIPSKRGLVKGKCYLFLCSRWMRQVRWVTCQWRSSTWTVGTFWPEWMRLKLDSWRPGWRWTLGENGCMEADEHLGRKISDGKKFNFHHFDYCFLVMFRNLYHGLYFGTVNTQTPVQKSCCFLIEALLEPIHASQKKHNLMTKISNHVTLNPEWVTTWVCSHLISPIRSIYACII